MTPQRQRCERTVAHQGAARRGASANLGTPRADGGASRQWDQCSSRIRTGITGH